MGFLRNVKTSIDDQSSINVNNISLLVSSLIGFLLGLVMCFVLVYDVLTNGYIKTDLTDAGIFLLCSGGYIAGSGIPKTIVDSRLKVKTGIANQELVEEAEDMRRARRRARRKEEDSPKYSPDDDYMNEDKLLAEE
jgi:hypothetical protein